MNDEYRPEVLIGQIDHPKHGLYFIWYNPELDTYGITKSAQRVHCGYAELSTLLKQKGL